MPLVYTIGAIIGPVGNHSLRQLTVLTFQTLGGALANPRRINPRNPPGNSFFEKYPYCLPNLVAAAVFLVGIIAGWLFLKVLPKVFIRH